MFLTEKTIGEPHEEWPYWYCDYGYVHHETDYLEPYSYVVLPQPNKDTPYDYYIGGNNLCRETLPRRRGAH